MRELGLRTTHTTFGCALVASLAIAACSRAGTLDPVAKLATGRAAPSKAAPTIASNSTEASPAPTDTRQTASTTRVYDDTTKSIDTFLGDRVTINLPANITTPYQWVLAPADAHSIVVLAERHYQDKPPADCQACVGYPGTDRLTLEAKAVGTTTLTLRYVPIRAKSGGAERELSIRVTVQNK